MKCPGEGVEPHLHAPMTVGQEPVGLYSVALRIRLCGSYFSRFLTHGTAMGLQIVENLPSHDRILASTGKVRQAPSSDFSLRSKEFL